MNLDIILKNIFYFDRGGIVFQVQTHIHHAHIHPHIYIYIASTYTDYI